MHILIISAIDESVRDHSLLIEDRIQRDTEFAAQILGRLRLDEYVGVRIRRSTISGRKLFMDLLGEKGRVPVIDYTIKFPTLSQEFAATFRLLLDHYTHEFWGYRKQNLSQRPLKRFYDRIIRLDKILTEFKRKARLSSFPSHVLAIDAIYLVEGGVRVEAEYYPAGKVVSCFVTEDYQDGQKIMRTMQLPTYIEEVRQGQSMCTVFTRTAPLRLDGRFIHELIHHIQHTVGLEITENERTMLRTARRYLKDSWIPSRFEKFIAQEEKK
jgi:hypothetical protein